MNVSKKHSYFTSYLYEVATTLFGPYFSRAELILMLKEDTMALHYRQQ
jgi:hypothetical protein